MRMILKTCQNPSGQDIVFEKFNLGKCAVINFSWFTNESKIEKYKTMLEKCRSIDYIFLYEGDVTFPQFLEYLKGNVKFEDLKGIAYLDKKTNTAKLAPYAPLVSNLDDIPIPKWDLVPINKYYK